MEFCFVLGIQQGDISSARLTLCRNSRFFLNISFLDRHCIKPFFSDPDGLTAAALYQPE